MEKASNWVWGEWILVPALESPSFTQQMLLHFKFLPCWKCSTGAMENEPILETELLTNWPGIYSGSCGTFCAWYPGRSQHLNDQNERKQCTLLGASGEGPPHPSTTSMSARVRLICKVKNSYTWIYDCFSDQLITPVSFWLKRKFLATS